MIKKVLLMLLLLSCLTLSIYSNESINTNEGFSVDDYILTETVKKDMYTIIFQYNKFTNDLRIIYREYPIIKYDEGRIRTTIFKHVVDWINNPEHRFYHFKIVNYKVTYDKVISPYIIMNQVDIDSIVWK